MKPGAPENGKPEAEGVGVKEVEGVGDGETCCCSSRNGRLLLLSLPTVSKISASRRFPEQLLTVFASAPMERGEEEDV